MKKILIYLFLLFSSHSFATNYLVHNAAEITAILPSVVGDDHIILANGTWTNQHVAIDGLEGTADHNIYVEAETPGGVILTGLSSLIVSRCYYVQVSGIYFHTIQLSDSLLNPRLVQILNPSQHCRITNCAFRKVTEYPISGRSHWAIQIAGQYNRLDHLYMDSMAYQGPTINVDAIDYAYTLIDSNSFGIREPIPGLGNGGETIRITCCFTTTNILAYTTIKDNYFYRCSAEQEIISVKASRVTMIHNLVKDCQGLFSIRQGHDSRIEKNFFINDNDTTKTGTQAYGLNHTIVNNYFYRCGGVPFTSVLHLANGEPIKSCDVYPKFQQSKNFHFDSNVIANSNRPVVMGYNAFVGQLLPPLSVFMTANIFLNLTNGIDTVMSAPLIFKAKSNLYYGTTTTFTEGFTNVNPVMTQDSYGVHRLTNSSPQIAKNLDTSPELILSALSNTNPVDVAYMGTQGWSILP